jgi:hypothetical protein
MPEIIAVELSDQGTALGQEQAKRVDDRVALALGTLTGESHRTVGVTGRAGEAAEVMAVVDGVMNNLGDCIPPRVGTVQYLQYGFQEGLLAVISTQVQYPRHFPGA